MSNQELKKKNTEIIYAAFHITFTLLRVESPDKIRFMLAGVDRGSVFFNGEIITAVAAQSM